MEGIKCSGCKWFSLGNGFCRSPRNIGPGSDCYEPEEKSVAVPKIDYIRQENNGYLNSKTKEEIIMEEVKCSGCKWFQCINVNGVNHGFCRNARNMSIDSDCYEPEEEYYAATKIDCIRKEIDEYINSKSKEEIEEEINETESTFDQLHNYLENATQEQLDKDWEELKQYNEVGPEVVDLVEQTAYKAGYDAAMAEFKLFLYKCSFCSTSYHVYDLIREKLEELQKDDIVK